MIFVACRHDRFSAAPLDLQAHEFRSRHEDENVAFSDSGVRTAKYPIGQGLARLGAPRSPAPRCLVRSKPNEKDLTACLGTETNTFASIPTGHQLFEETCLFRKASYGKNMPMFGAPLAVWRGRAEAKGWQMVESLCAFAMPAGKTVKKVYEAFRDEIVADLKAAMPVDAVFLSMHGAMVAEGYDDCESDLLAHVRKVVGPDVPVGVELDLHCNIGDGTFATPRCWCCSRNIRMSTCRSAPTTSSP